jgi:hypothetical protein
VAAYLNATMTKSGRVIIVSPQILADASGTVISHLIQALPQLRPGPADHNPTPADIQTAETRLACRRCMAAKNIFCDVTVLAWTDQNVCLRHQLWTGHGVTGIEDQADMAGIPEISEAQARHRNLARRHGFPSVRDAYGTAELAIDWSSRESSSPTARQERLRNFLARERVGALPQAYDYASYYPEVVGVLSVLASPYWQRMAGSGDVTEALRFYRQVASNGLTNGSPAQNTPSAAGS